MDWVGLYETVLLNRPTVHTLYSYYLGSDIYSKRDINITRLHIWNVVRKRITNWTVIHYVLYCLWYSCLQQFSWCCTLTSLFTAWPHLPHFQPSESGWAGSRCPCWQAALNASLAPPPSHLWSPQCSRHYKWWTGGGLSQCRCDPPWLCPGPLALSSHSLCPGQRWLRPAARSWGPSPGHGRWQSSASVHHWVAYLLSQRSYCSPNKGEPR